MLPLLFTYFSQNKPHRVPSDPLRYNRRNLSQPNPNSDSVRCSEAIFTLLYICSLSAQHVYDMQWKLLCKIFTRLLSSSLLFYIFNCQNSTKPPCCQSLRLKCSHITVQHAPFAKPHLWCFHAASQLTLLIIIFPCYCLSASFKYHVKIGEFVKNSNPIPPIIPTITKGML